MYNIRLIYFTLHNGSCAKLKWECVNGVARCKNETVNKYEQDTVCTNAGLTKPTCATPKTYYITPSITPVTNGTHLEIHLDVKDENNNYVNLPDDERLDMYFKYEYYYASGRIGPNTISINSNNLSTSIVGRYSFATSENPQFAMTNPKILDAGFDSSFTTQKQYGIDTYIMNPPEVKISPECGDARGREFSSKPNDQLCAVGTASPVVGNGPWDRTCSNDGETKSCTADAYPEILEDDHVIVLHNFSDGVIKIANNSEYPFYYDDTPSYWDQDCRDTTNYLCLASQQEMTISMPRSTCEDAGPFTFYIINSQKHNPLKTYHVGFQCGTSYIWFYDNREVNYS